MKIHKTMLNCNGCEYLQASEGDYYLVCNDGNHWVEGVPESPPCFKVDHEGIRKSFVVIASENISATKGQ